MDLANYDLKEKEIGGNTFYVRPFAPLIALELLGDLQAVVTTSLEKVEVRDVPNVAVDDGKQQKKSLFDKDISLGAAIAGIGQNLKGPMLVKFATRILNPEYVSVKLDGKTEAVKLTPAIYNNIFAGRLKDLIELLWFIIVDVNYADFFESTPSLTGLLTALEKK